MAAPADRYEPLPGLFGLPTHFLRKLSPRGRRVVAVLAAVLPAGAVVAAIVLVPRITESKRDYAAAQREARAQAAERRARLIAEQRPRRGRVDLGASAPNTVLIGGVERAITRDVRTRVAAGELQNPARRTDCRALGRDGGRLILGCTAVTSELATTEEITGATVGYSFRAAIGVSSGRYAFCKASGRPALGFTEQQRAAVALSPACGG